MLTQKVMGYVTESNTLLKVQGDCFAGLACTGQHFHAVGVTPKGIFVETDGQRQLVKKGSFKRVYFRITNNTFSNSHQFFYSLDGKNFMPAGEPFSMRIGFWKGIRVGLFCYGNGGVARFDEFKMKE